MSLTQLLAFMGVSALVSVLVGVIALVVVLKFELVDHLERPAVRIPTEPALQILRYGTQPTPRSTRKQSGTGSDNTVIRPKSAGLSAVS